MKKIVLGIAVVMTLGSTFIASATQDYLTVAPDGPGGGSYFKSTGNCYDNSGNWVKVKVWCMDGGGSECTKVDC